MKLALAILLSLLCGSTPAQPSSTHSASVRFAAVDIFVDSRDKAFAAYQLDFSITNNGAKIVGIEGGGHAAFREPPFYDPKVMQQERVVLAAFSTQKQLPTGKTRVATIHLQMTGTVEPEIQLRLQVIADADGKRVSATTSFETKAKK